MSAIHRAAFRDGETWGADTIRALLDRPGTVAVARAPDGFALLQVLPPDAELLTIAVAPAAQGLGVGSGLLRDIRARLDAAGCTALHLEVAADNAPARALYARADFVETGRRRGYYARTGAAAADALVLTLSLPAQQSGKGPMP
jgi:ribosomal-protein-alanine N-acetyltransferase